jgi:sugar phosphate isomerase/epimerase
LEVFVALSRRDFLGSSLAVAAAGIAGTFSYSGVCFGATGTKSSIAKMRFGLVTYQWGADWNLPTLIQNCQKGRADGVELRTEHAHKVEPSLTSADRKDVKARFADSPITLVGLGSIAEFHDPNPDVLKKQIADAKAFIKLSHDVGGSGVKVRPNGLPKGVSKEKTIEQIGRSLNEIGKFGADFDQQVRLEVHGSATSSLPIIAQIMAVADHPNVAVCWNSNRTDLDGDGLEANFHLVEKRLGATTHVNDLVGKKYPYPKLFEQLKKINYTGWILAEESKKVDDRVAALVQARETFDRLISA